MALFRFLRVPAAPTASADVLAGFALVTVPQRSISDALIAASASFALYLGGMGLNDLRDREHDAIHRPSRPIPSGQISVATARAVVLICFTAGICLAAAGGSAVFRGALILTAMIAAYDLGGKGVPVAGPILMGTCRGMNLHLGAIAAGGVSFVFPLLHGLYTASLTLGAAHEEGTSLPRRLIGFAVLCAATSLAAALLAPSPWPAALLAVLLGAVLVATSVRAVSRSSVLDARRWVKYGVLGFLLYDAALLAGCGRWTSAGVLVALLPVCLLVGRAIPPS